MTGDSTRRADEELRGSLVPAAGYSGTIRPDGGEPIVISDL
ncbi:hypothetical protein [Candidatus Amarobacter glycogenicus]